MRIARNQLCRYSAMAVPIAFAGFPLYVLAPDYYATTHGVSLSVLGVLLLALRLFDAIIDPLIGYYSDKHRHALGWGMGIAAVLMCGAIYGLFNQLPTQAALWFAVCVAVAVTGYSVLSININMLGGLWTQDPAEQTRITTAREACGLVGLVVAVALPSLLKEVVPPAQVYLYFCLILSGCMAGAWLLFAPWLGRQRSIITPHTPHAVTPSLWAGLRAPSRVTKQFLGIYGLSMLASSIPAVLVLFFVRDLLGAEHLTGVFLLLYFLAGALAMPLWQRASRYWGHYRAWLLAMLLSVVTFSGAFLLQAGDVWGYAAVCVLSGLALGADLALPPAILAQQVHASHTQAHAATQYALLALVAKLGLALASFIALPLLGMAGFVPAAPNNDWALLLLSISYALIPCLLKISAIVWLWRLMPSFTKGTPTDENQ